MTGRLTGKIALVFGAGSSGAALSNGRAAALAFAREGATVAAIDRNHTEAHLTAAEITAAGGTAVALVADVTDEHQVRSVVAQARSCRSAFAWIASCTYAARPGAMSS